MHQNNGLHPSTFSDILPRYPNAVPLSQGGQKLVYKYDHPDFGAVVIKLGLTSDMGYAIREADTLRSIESKYYPRCYDFESLDDKRFVAIEQFMAGQNLRDCLHLYYPLPKAIWLIRELIFGLDILWSRKITHRDIKPENIIITPSNQVVIIDLGIARHLGLTSLTNTMQPYGSGTPGYMAPEQINNFKRIIDQRTDIFSVGVILAELLRKGVGPFDSISTNGADPITSALNGQWDRSWYKQNGLGAFVPLLEGMLAVQPHKRPRNAFQLFSNIELALRNHGGAS